MSLPGNYPKYLVNKLGIDTLRKLSKETPKRKNNNNTSRARPMQVKVENFAMLHENFTVGMCAKCCSAKKEVVLPILQQIPYIHINPDGSCFKLSGKKLEKAVS